MLTSAAEAAAQAAAEAPATFFAPPHRDETPAAGVDVADSTLADYQRQTLSLNRSQQVIDQLTALLMNSQTMMQQMIAAQSGQVLPSSALPPQAIAAAPVAVAKTWSYTCPCF